jgi:hypothetical protein
MEEGIQKGCEIIRNQENMGLKTSRKVNQKN